MFSGTEENDSESDGLLKREAHQLNAKIRGTTLRPIHNLAISAISESLQGQVVHVLAEEMH